MCIRDSGKGDCKRGKCECQLGYRGVSCEQSYPCDPIICAKCDGDKCGACTQVGLNTKTCQNTACSGCNHICWKGDCYCSQTSNETDCIPQTSCNINICDVCEDDKCVKCKEFASDRLLCIESCKKDCSGRGTCVAGTCTCNQGFTGEACEKEQLCNRTLCANCEGDKCLQCVDSSRNGSNCESQKCTGNYVWVNSSNDCLCKDGWYNLSANCTQQIRFPRCNRCSDRNDQTTSYGDECILPNETQRLKIPHYHFVMLMLAYILYRM
eukprot:TRINITY_DN20945_c0_g1_i2.p1 TRINITY_DN20945_c0_g1~~TRINITY_DN20945_c0_g1_i2.p1  ORF type:complete len:286 (-),score=23.54 TRINITY_DN20945_c0_g1_i2:128-928(-)